MTDHTQIVEGATVKFRYEPTGEVFTTKAHRGEVGGILVLGWSKSVFDPNHWTQAPVELLEVHREFPQKFGAVIRYPEDQKGSGLWVNVSLPQTRTKWFKHQESGMVMDSVTLPKNFEVVSEGVDS